MASQLILQPNSPVAVPGKGTLVFVPDPLISASAAAAPVAVPVSFGSPYTNTTGLLFHTHYQVSNTVGGVGNGPADQVAGYVAEQQEDLALGIKVWDCDFGSLSPQYQGNLALIYQAATKTGMKIMLVPDMSGGIGEDAASISALADLFLQYAANPATLTWPDPLTKTPRPCLSMYAGDGGGPTVVKSVYGPMLAKIRAAGFNVFFVPGWSDPAELSAVGADGGWTFANTTPIGVNASLPGIEALGAAVQATKTAAGAPLLFMMPIFPAGYWDAGGRNGRFYNEFGGFRTLAAQTSSLVNTVKPQWAIFIGKNDVNEGSPYSSLARTSTWNGLPFYGVPDFYQVQDGLQRAMRYCVQWGETGQLPLIQADTLSISSRVQLAAASLHPTNDPLGGVGFVQGLAGDAPGLQDEINVRAELTKAAFVRVTGCGSLPDQFAAAGVTDLVFRPTQAGVPLASIVRQGQVTRQVQGHAIAGAAALANVNPASFVSVPGIKFTLSATVPPGFNLDHAALMCRSTSTAYKAMGVCNAAAYDLSTGSPVLFAQNTLNVPATGQAIDQVTPPGADALSQYDLGYGLGQILLSADPLDSTQPPLAYPGSNSNNCLYDFAAKPLPSAHVRVHCRVVSTNADPSADGQGGCGFVVRTNANPYFGIGVWTYIEKYAGVDTFYIKAENNISQDAFTSGAAVLASLPVNTLAPGEWYDVDLEVNGTALTATATPSNQQN